jgi:hypothetical protein
VRAESKKETRSGGKTLEIHSAACALPFREANSRFCISLRSADGRTDRASERRRMRSLALLAGRTTFLNESFSLGALSAGRQHRRERARHYVLCAKVVQLKIYWPLFQCNLLSRAALLYLYIWLLARGAEKWFLLPKMYADGPKRSLYQAVKSCSITCERCSFELYFTARVF